MTWRDTDTYVSILTAKSILQTHDHDSTFTQFPLVRDMELLSDPRVTTSLVVEANQRFYQSFSANFLERKSK